jgi:hypothetical protein
VATGTGDAAGVTSQLPGPAGSTATQAVNQVGSTAESQLPGGGGSTTLPGPLPGTGGLPGTGSLTGALGKAGAAAGSLIGGSASRLGVTSP